MSVTDAEEAPGVERLLTLTDGVVAIALTLLVLQLVVPPIDGVSTKNAQSAHYLWTQLKHRGGDQLTAYVVSFYVIAQFWLTHHRVFRSIRGHDEGLAWWNFAFLFTITIMPFSSDLIGRFGSNPLAIDLFALNLLLASLSTQGLRVFARRHGLEGRFRPDPYEARTSYFRVWTVNIVIVFTAGLAWFDASVAIFCWLLLLPAQRVATRLATRYPGRPAPA